MLSREDTNTAVKIPSKYGSKALEEIRMYQHSVNELIPKAPFKRLVRELVADTQVDGLDGNISRVHASAFEAAQLVAEQKLVELFEMSQLVALHCKRQTIRPGDLEMVAHLCSKKREM